MILHLAFFLAGAVFFMMAPFLPMLREIILGTDVRPSDIPRDLSVDPRGSVEQILWCHVYQLGLGSVEQLREYLGKVDSGAHHSGAYLLNARDRFPGKISESQLIGYGPVQTPAGLRSGAKILSLTEATAGAGSRLVEIHALGPLTLGEGTRILWWASGETVRVGLNAVLTGKITGAREIRLRGGSLFHLLEAPTIRFGEWEPARELRSYHRQAPREPIPGQVSWEKTTRRRICKGEVRIADLMELDSDLIVHGRLVVGEGTLIRGSVKATAGIELKRNCVILGSLISPGSIRIEPECHVRGPIVSEDTLVLEAGVRIGEPERRTTTIGRRILVRGPCRAHGLVRAWKLGEVRAPASGMTS